MPLIHVPAQYEHLSLSEVGRAISLKVAVGQFEGLLAIWVGVIIAKYNVNKAVIDVERKVFTAPYSSVSTILPVIRTQ